MEVTGGRSPRARGTRRSCFGAPLRARSARSTRRRRVWRHRGASAACRRACSCPRPSRPRPTLRSHAAPIDAAPQQSRRGRAFPTGRPSPPSARPGRGRQLPQRARTRRGTNRSRSIGPLAHLLRGNARPDLPRPRRTSEHRIRSRQPNPPQHAGDPRGREDFGPRAEDSVILNRDRRRFPAGQRHPRIRATQSHPVIHRHMRAEGHKRTHDQAEPPMHDVQTASVSNRGRKFNSVEREDLSSAPAERRCLLRTKQPGDEVRHLAKLPSTRFCRPVKHPVNPASCPHSLDDSRSEGCPRRLSTQSL